jgi:hypothetical protein
MTFTEKLPTSQPPIEVAGRRFKRGAAPGQPELDCPDDDPTHFIVVDRPWIGCVWELPPIHRERNAWVRHILMPDAPDLDGYLADSMLSGHTR